MRIQSFFAGLAQAAMVLGLAIDTTQVLEQRTSDLRVRQSCNTPSNRACWSTGFNINTDWETSIPNTGVTRTVSWL